MRQLPDRIALDEIAAVHIHKQRYGRRLRETHAILADRLVIANLPGDGFGILFAGLYHGLAYVVVRVGLVAEAIAAPVHHDEPGLVAIDEMWKHIGLLADRHLGCRDPGGGVGIAILEFCADRFRHADAVAGIRAWGRRRNLFATALDVRIEMLQALDVAGKAAGRQHDTAPRCDADRLSVLLRHNARDRTILDDQFSGRDTRADRDFHIECGFGQPPDHGIAARDLDAATITGKLRDVARQPFDDVEEGRERAGRIEEMLQIVV
ncbi:hypothetical protein D9M73_128760 [compost metagenome]